MYTIKLNKEDATFAALKLIEQLYMDKKISEKVYRSIILEKASDDQIRCFTGFATEVIRRKGE